MIKLLVFSWRYSILLFLPSIVCAQNVWDRGLLIERDIVYPVHPTRLNSSVSFNKLTTWPEWLSRQFTFILNIKAKSRQYTLFQAIKTILRFFIEIRVTFPLIFF